MSAKQRDLSVGMVVMVAGAGTIVLAQLAASLKIAFIEAVLEDEHVAEAAGVMVAIMGLIITITALRVNERQRDLFAGALAFIVGLGIALIAQNYKIGTLTAMGPGYFPAALGSLLAFMGVVIFVTALTSKAEVAEAPPAQSLHHGFADHFDWRGWICIVGSVVAFMVLAEYMGLLPATFFCVFVGCWGDKDAKFAGSLIFPLGITVFGSLLFSFLLHVQIPSTRERSVPLAALAVVVLLFVWNIISKTGSISAFVPGSREPGRRGRGDAGDLLRGAFRSLSPGLAFPLETRTGFPRCRTSCTCITSAW